MAGTKVNLRNYQDSYLLRTSFVGIEHIDSVVVTYNRGTECLLHAEIDIIYGNNDRSYSF